MKIDIDHIAALAKLEIDPAQKQAFQAQMENMLALVDSLPEIEGTLVELDPQNPMRLRADVAQPSFSREDILKNAPLAQAGCIVVPKVIE